MTDLIEADDALAADAMRMCQELIQIDSSNFGDGSGAGERLAGEYVAAQLTEVGLNPEYVESAPRRGNILLRIEGSDADAPGLAVHGHLDTVPAVAADWSVPPHSAEMADGCVWGRGAIDMKAMNAMILANVRRRAMQGRRPRRTLVIAFFADEEALSVLGSHWVVDHRPEYFEGVSEAITEVGGFSVSIPSSGGSQRVYLLQTAEKGTLWLRLRARGRAGHGSVPNPESAVGRLADAISRISHHEFPLHYLESVQALMTGLAEISGAHWSRESPEELTPLLGSSRPFVDASMRDTVNATIVSGGYLNNVVPQNADAWLDCRFLPGHEETLLETITQLAGEHVEVTVHRRDVALEASFQVPLVDQMRQSLVAEDPAARVLPYCLAAGTDNKALSRLGIRGYGFAPMKLPPELDFANLFHGVDERIPISSVAFGARVLRNFLDAC